MKAEGSPAPVHLHVAETASVHVHLMKSPKSQHKASQMRRSDVSGREERASHHSPVGSKSRTPWRPPGRTPAWAESGSYKQDAEERQGRSQTRSSKPNRMKAQSKRQQRSQADWTCRALQNQDLEASEPQDEPEETDLLLRALVEAEIDGVAVVNQLTALRETMDGLTKGGRLSKMDTASMGRHQEALLDKMALFDSTNRSLREMLREFRDSAGETVLSAERRDELRTRLCQVEAENTRLLAKLTIKEKEAMKLTEHLDLEKDNIQTTEELSRILESTREHLESELVRKEERNEQQAAQIQRLQRSLELQQEELQAQQEEVEVLRRRRQEDRERRDMEAITWSTQQAQQAQRAEDTCRQLSAQLEDMEFQLAAALSSSKDWSVRFHREKAARTQVEEEASALKHQVEELQAQLCAAEEKTRTEWEELTEQALGLSRECSSTQLENQTLKASIRSAEETLRDLQSEAAQMKTLVRTQEIRVEKYKSKVQQARRDSEECCVRLEEAQREAREAKARLERELEGGQLSSSLLARIQELEQRAEQLRRAERQLEEAEDAAKVEERRSREQKAALLEVQHRVEQQAGQLETLQQKNFHLQEDNNLLKGKMESLERKLEELNRENRDLVEVVSNKEATARSARQRLEERSGECEVLSRKLEQTLEDAKKQVDESVQRALAKERASQSKALDLQSQLSCAKNDLVQLRQTKEEMERRYQFQLRNIKERLEQADSTNRTLHNYVHFLKTTYGNVFGDSLLAS